MSCPGCALQLVQVAALANTYGEPGSQESFLALTSGARGSVYALYNRATAEVVEHDSTGAVVRRIGRRGGGPGEFRRITALHVHDDTLFVFDGVGGRISALDASGTYVRGTGLTALPYDAIVLPHGRFVVNAAIAAPPAAGYPLHILAADGALVKSFGADSALQDVSQQHLLRRHMARQDAHEFWTAPRHEYRLERWNADGERLQVISRRPVWFEGSLRPPSLHPDTVPNGQVVGIRAVDSLLWVVLRVPAATWREGLVERRSETGRVVYGISDPDRVFDTVIEVLSVSDGSLVHSERFDRAFGRLLDDGRLTHVRYAPDGTPHITLWRAALQRPTVDDY